MLDAFLLHECLCIFWKTIFISAIPLHQCCSRVTPAGIKRPLSHARPQAGRLIWTADCASSGGRRPMSPSKSQISKFHRNDAFLCSHTTGKLSNQHLSEPRQYEKRGHVRRKLKERFNKRGLGLLHTSKIHAPTMYSTTSSSLYTNPTSIGSKVSSLRPTGFPSHRNGQHEPRVIPPWTTTPDQPPPPLPGQEIRDPHAACTRRLTGTTHTYLCRQTGSSRYPRSGIQNKKLYVVYFFRGAAAMISLNGSPLYCFLFTKLFPATYVPNWTM